MDSNDTILLESKLKRLRISFSKENGKIIISQAKMNYVVLIFLIILPILLGIGLTSFFFFEEINIFEFSGTKTILLIGGMFFTAFANLYRMRIKQKINKATKILGYKYITLTTKDQSVRFDAHTIEAFEYIVEEGEGDDDENKMYHGTLFLVDTKQQKHLLIGFDAESEQYLIDDLKWFKTYFEKHVQLNS
ncbi:hypothetical protein [Kordia sp.]|uniref:hypothetical protein n=1 Tax=Kordia sp. TaxID=1965332 RepID=UPI003D6BB365